MSSQRRAHRRRPSEGLVPPHCPNRECPYYTPAPEWRYIRDGIYVRPSDHRRFDRWRCRCCGRCFSARTFEADYGLRHRALFRQIVRLCSEGPGLRQIGRLVGTTHATVGRHLARAGRHCLLVHREMLTDWKLSESLVVDGFETFEYSQYFPIHLNLAVGSQSWMLYHFTDSPLRREGSMTPVQRLRRERIEATLGRPDPKAIENGMVDLLRALLSRPSGLDASHPPVILHSDDHPAYRRSLRRLREDPAIPPIHHRVTSSIERRTTSNPLFPVNLADLLVRHGQAAHRRETIAFCKRRQGAIERLAVFMVWRNLIKSRREKNPGQTAAMAAGVVDRPWGWNDVFERRRFPRRSLLPDPWWAYYWRRVKTPALGESQAENRLRYAF